MAGNFIKSSYQASYNVTTPQIHPIKIQPETLLASIGGVANSAPAGAINNPISAEISRNKRQRGLHPRSVTLRAPTTAPPAGYMPGGLTKIPCLTTAFYTACTAATSATVVTYLGASYTVAYTTNEEAI